MIKRTRGERVHADFSDLLNKMWNDSGREISKVSLTKRIAKQLKTKKNPKYVVNYWPLSKKKVRVY